MSKLREEESYDESIDRHRRLTDEAEDKEYSKSSEDEALQSRSKWEIGKDVKAMPRPGDRFGKAIYGEAKSEYSTRMSGGAHEDDIKLNDDRDVKNLPMTSGGYRREKPESDPHFSRVGIRGTQFHGSDVEGSPSPQVEGSTNDPNYFGGKLGEIQEPKFSSIPLEGQTSRDDGKGKAKDKSFTRR